MRSLYRFVSFFELYDLLTKFHLTMSRLMLMSDQNEGLGDVLKLQESITFGWGLNSQEKIIEFHNATKGRTYISSWTSEPDLMAMWLLYSPNNDSIRIKTTQDKLNEVLNNYWNKNYWPNHLDSEEGTIQLDGLAIVDNVEYISFEEASELVKNKYKKYYEILDQEFVNIKEFKLSSHLNEFMTKAVISSNFGCLLKDQAYTHEKEVRALFTACLRNSISREELIELNKKDNTSAVFGTATCHYPPSSELPNIIRIPTSKNFIESICFDPRMPKYKIATFMDIFSGYLDNIDIEESHAFGYKPEKYDFTIKVE